MAENTIAKVVMYVFSKIHYKIYSVYKTDLGAVGHINTIFYSVDLFLDAGMHLLI